MKKFLLIGFISFFAFFNTTYAVDYKKNVDDYSINEVFSSEILANEKKDNEVKKLEEIRKNVLGTGGFYSYDISVNPILSDDKVTKVFESIDDYKNNLPLYEKEYKNALFFIKLSERFNDKDALDKRISFLKNEFDDFSYEVSNDYESMNFNTAISQMMIFVNAVYKEDKITKEYASGFVKLLNPIAPHITEEIWHTFLGHTDTIANETWPSYDETKITEDTYTMVVQVNGKLRGKIDVSSETSKEEMERLAKSIPNVISFIDGKEIVKVITVPKKLVNIVVK